MKNLLIIFYIIFITGTIINASEPALFLKYGKGVKAISMGESQTALNQGGYTWQANPASLAYTKYNEINYSFSNVLNSINNIHIGYTKKLTENTSFSIGYLSSAITGIEEADENGNLTGVNFDYGGSVIYIALGSNLPIKELKNISIGTTIKRVEEKLFNNKGSGYQLDLGLLYKLFPRLALGIKYENALATDIKWNTGSNYAEKLEKKIIAGIGLFPLENLAIACDINQQKQINLGIEYSLYLNQKLEDAGIAFRAGINNGIYTLGLGVALFDLFFDYAYKNNLYDYMEKTHFFNFGIRFF